MTGFESLLLGRLLADRYRIEEVIGRGGMGAVYRATDERLRRTVAAKVLMLPTDEPGAREHLRTRFQREARAAASIRHPHVITIYDFGSDEELGLDFLVMELLHGQDLATRLERSGAFPLLPAVTILRDAARGLGAGHALGLVHRDVKPGNVFLAENPGSEHPRVCILDFGIAQVSARDEDTLTQLTQEGRVPLSPAYASPEQLRGESHLTPASDVFSLGVIGFQLLTGERFYEVTRAGRRTEDESVALPGIRRRNALVPRELEAILHRALAHDPGQRFPEAGAFAAALDETVETLVSTVLVGPGAKPKAKSAPPGTATAAPRAAASTEAAPRPAAPLRPGDGPTLSTQEPSPRPPRPGARTAGRRPIAPVAALALLLVLATGAAAFWMFGRGATPPDGAPPAEQTAVATADRPAADMTPELPGAEPAPPVTEPTPPGAEPALPVERPTARDETPPAGPASSPAAATAAGLNAEGLRLLQQGNIAAANERLRRAVELAPASAEYRNNYGWGLYREGRLGDAEREIRRVIELDPRREIAYANLGEVRAAQGDTVQAIALYERFLELNRDPLRRRVAEEKLRALRSP
jgi:eukaryotic-like serine/threonine-protein kinase